MNFFLSVVNKLEKWWDPRSVLVFTWMVNGWTVVSSRWGIEVMRPLISFSFHLSVSRWTAVHSGSGIEVMRSLICFSFHLISQWMNCCQFQMRHRSNEASDRFQFPLIWIRHRNDEVSDLLVSTWLVNGWTVVHPGWGIEVMRSDLFQCLPDQSVEEPLSFLDEV